MSRLLACGCLHQETNTPRSDGRQVGFDDLLRPFKEALLVTLEGHVNVPFEVPMASKRWTLIELKDYQGAS